MDANDRTCEVPCCRVTLLTPPRRGAIAVLSVEGPQATQCVARCFASRAGVALQQFPLDRIVFGRWQSDLESPDATAGEEVVVCRRGEDRVEVNCHGGVAAATAIRDGLRAAGAIVQDDTQWLATRAGDSLEAEALAALRDAATERVAAILLDQCRGVLREALAETIDDLRRGCVEQARSRLRGLLDAARVGRHLTDPWRIVFAGPPNVGKSSLINRLLGYRRAIVFDQPGTTRDLLTATTALDGWPVELVDTAGLRTSGDAIEMAGVARTAAMLDRADLLVLVFDATRNWDASHDQLLRERSQALAVINKTDLQPPPAQAAASCLATSAATGAGIERLMEQMVERMVSAPLAAGQAVPFTSRQIAALQQASDASRRGEQEQAADALEALLGASHEIGRGRDTRR